MTRLMPQMTAQAQGVPTRPRLAIGRARPRTFFGVGLICGNLSFRGHRLFPHLPEFAVNDFSGGFAGLLKSPCLVPFKLAVDGNFPRLCGSFPSKEGIDVFLAPDIGPCEFPIALFWHS